MTGALISPFYQLSTADVGIDDIIKLSNVLFCIVRTSGILYNIYQRHKLVKDKTRRNQL